ncbi:MAG: CCA tRNA nucleotidyltransferase [Candidatus Omnitrophica bacterium]|nr:CCA tRNA nucleotidyltransferase [Candidatus Omnitrophota bacterium]
MIKLSSQDLNLLKIIYNSAVKKKLRLFLVGGFLRDYLLGRQKINPDFDFAIKKGSINFGRKLAREMRAGFVVLDKEHGACRVVKKSGGKAYTFDFTDFRGRDLEDDLLHRDFTINTLALDLKDIFSAINIGNFILDPFSARKDIKSGIIRVANKKSFDEDPLRILRAFSFSALLGFKIENKTLALAQKERRKLSVVSFERIRDELFKVFDTKNAYQYLATLDKLKILEIIIPEINLMRGVNQGPYHHLDVWKHSLETAKQFERLSKELENNKDVQDYLREYLSGDRKRSQLLKLAAILHDIGKPKAKRRFGNKIKFHGHERVGLDIAEGIAKRLKLSRDEINALHKMVLWHLRPGYLGDFKQPSKRAIFRYFRDTQNEAVAVLLLSVADQRSTLGRLSTKKSSIQHEIVCFGLIKEYFRRLKEKKFERLINGNELMRRFKLNPSVLVGKILKEIEELQAIGKVKTKEEAFKAAEKIVKKQK